MSAPGQKHKSFASELRAELVSSISDLTMHGPSKVASTTNILRRMFWVCIVLVGWTACVLLTVQYFNQYLAYETVTNIAIRLDQKKPNFPAVTICGVRTPDIKCLFDQGICTNDIVHLVNTENFFGCSAFNTGRDRLKNPVAVYTSTETNQDYGLKLSMNLSVINGDGIAVYIHSQIAKKSRSQKVIISPNMETSLVVDRTIETRLGEPYNVPCLNTISLARNETSQPEDVQYVQEDCLRLCEYEAKAGLCNLTQNFTVFKNLFYFDEDAFDVAKWNLMTPCIQSDPNFFRNLRESDHLETCPIECPYECQLTSYTIFSYSQRLDGISNETKLNVYYRAHKRTEITEVPKMTGADLFANIAGITGLLIGASIISFVEILEMMLWLVYFGCKNKGKWKNEIKDGVADNEKKKPKQLNSEPVASEAPLGVVIPEPTQLSDLKLA